MPFKISRCTMIRGISLLVLILWFYPVNIFEPNLIHPVKSEANIYAEIGQYLSNEETNTLFLENLSRSIEDRTDEQSVPQVKLMYIIPSDGIDRELDTNGVLANSFNSLQNWFTEQTGGQKLTVDTYEGNYDILFYQMEKTDDEIADRGAFVRDEIETALQEADLLVENKIYAVYYDGTSTWACGGGAWPPNLVGQVAAMYLLGLPESTFPCDQNQFAADGDPPSYLEFAMLHEIIHTLGFVAQDAPNQVLNGHVNDSNTDLMYAGDKSWIPSTLDLGNDDYYNHKGDQLDLANSPYLTDSLPLSNTKDLQKITSNTDKIESKKAILNFSYYSLIAVILLLTSLRKSVKRLNSKY